MGGLCLYDCVEESDVVFFLTGTHMIEDENNCWRLLRVASEIKKINMYTQCWSDAAIQRGDQSSSTQRLVYRSSNSVGKE